MGDCTTEVQVWLRSVLLNRMAKCEKAAQPHPYDWFKKPLVE